MTRWLSQVFFPSVATRRERWLNHAMLLSAAVAIGGAIAAVGFGYGFESWAGIVVAAGVVSALGFRKGLEVEHLRALALLRDAQFLVCPRCRYGLHASVREGRCPECGEKFDPASLRKEWTERYVSLLNRVASPGDEDERHRRRNPWF